MIIENTTNATTLPIEAIALRSKNTASSAADTAVTTRPTGTRSASRAPIVGGNWPVPAISSHNPAAGYRPAFVAPAVANRAVTVIIQ